MRGELMGNNCNCFIKTYIKGMECKIPRTLLEKWPWVSAGNRYWYQPDWSIPSIGYKKLGIFGIGCPNTADTNNEYIGIDCVR
jgi:hypothetical protein